jgi:16S rRNA G966 N2-methylase RsmD
MEELGQNKERFGLIFSDPPYSKDMAKKTLNSINHYDILIASGLLVIEHHKGEEFPAAEGGVFMLKQKFYKDTVISIYQKND